MAQYDTILATRYNTIKGKVSNVFTAYGFSASQESYDVKGDSAGTAPADTISNPQWDRLRRDIVRCYRHQNGYTPTITDIYQGLDIQWAHSVQYDVLADGLQSNQSQVYTGSTTGIYTQQATVSSGSGSTQTGDWNVKKVCTVTATWPSATEGNGFFALGGYVRLTFSHTAGTVNTKSGNWANLIDKLITLNPIVGPSGVGTIGPNSTVTYTDATVPYTENNVVIQTITDNGGARLRFIITFNDADVGDSFPDPTGYDQPGPAEDESVGIDITVNYEYRTSINEFSATAPTMTAGVWTDT